MPATRPTPDEARAELRARLTARAPEARALDDAIGATLAEPLTAAAPFPPFDAAAMDGFALAGPGPWELIDAQQAAGRHDSPALSPGQAVPIATGAQLPDGAERVVRHEESRLDGARLTVVDPARDDTRRTGSAWADGELLAPAGVAVTAAVESTARAGGVRRVTVRGPLRAVLHTSGDEVVPDDVPLGPGQIRDTASAQVAELLREAGFAVSRGRHLSDSQDVFAQCLSAAANTDLVVIIGATGHGVADHLRGALRATDAEVVLDGLAIRPGGSLLVSQLPSGTVALGLGGNPLAAVAGAAILAPAVVDGLTRRDTSQADHLDVVDAERHRHPTLCRVLPVEPDGTGRWIASPGSGTGHLRTMIGHRGLALFSPADADRRSVERLR